MAIGQKKPGENLGELEGVAFTEDGRVDTIDDEGRTMSPKVFAAGDCVTGGRELVHAVAAGKRAAGAISDYLMKNEGGA